jgi:hypothetical protein
VDTETRVALISGFVALVGIILTYLGTRKKPGLAADTADAADPNTVVEKLATNGINGMTPRQVSSAVTALAQTITDLQIKVAALQINENAYQTRLAVVTHIARYSTDPPPRDLPPWPDKPGGER